MELNLKFNIKAITIAEELLGKPFASIDFTSEEASIVILYAMTRVGEDDVFTLKNFKESLKAPRVQAELTKKSKRVMDYIAQFKNKEIEDNPQEHNPTSITDLANYLIVEGGISPEYVMNELELHRIKGLVEAVGQRKKEKMEENRLWTWLSVLPHTDSKKVPTPADFYAFPWEVEDLKNRAIKEIEDNTQRLENFLKKGGELINGR